jgi:RNA polymerase sigma-70 factor (ECF subfamily)
MTGGVTRQPAAGPTNGLDTAGTTRLTSDLIARARAGDRAALGELLARQTDFLLRVIAKLMGAALRRTIEPTDILQETLLIAAQRFTTFRGSDEQELTSWLCALARRKLIDFARHNGRLKRALKRRLSLDEPLNDDDQSLATRLPLDTCTASQVAVKRELSGKLAEALSQIDRREAEVLWLRYVDGMSLESIGRQIGVGRHGAGGLVSRALRNLRRLIPAC